MSLEGHRAGSRRPTSGVAYQKPSKQRRGGQLSSTADRAADEDIGEYEQAGKTEHEAERTGNPGELAGGFIEPHYLDHTQVVVAADDAGQHADEDADAAVRQALLNNPGLMTVRQQHGYGEAALVIAKTYPFNPVYTGYFAQNSGPASAGTAVETTANATAAMSDRVMVNIRMPPGQSDGSIRRVCRRKRMM